MPRIFGINFAPFSVPLERRLQTLVVAIHVLNFTVNPWIGIVAVTFMLFTRLWFVSLGYITWIIYDVYVNKTSSRGGRRSERLRRSKAYEYFRDYFPVSLVKTADLDPTRNYIMGYHPHGIIGFGALCNFGTEATGFSNKYPGIVPHMLTLGMNFRFPVLRGHILWLGLCDVSKESIKWILTKKGTGNAAIIVVGGAAEALEAKPGNYLLTLKNRKGFVRMALETGAALVPVFSFGENELYDQAENPKGSLVRKFQEAFKKHMGFSPPFFYGRGVFNYSFGLLPYRTPITTIVGAPIDVPHEPSPPSHLVDKYHQIYMDELSRLFDAHKTNFDVDPNKCLEFI